MEDYFTKVATCRSRGVGSPGPEFRSEIGARHGRLGTVYPFEHLVRNFSGAAVFPSRRESETELGPGAAGLLIMDRSPVSIGCVHATSKEAGC